METPSLPSSAIVSQPSSIGAAPRALTRSGTQFWPVTGYITDRLFVTYRAPARGLRPLVPAPLTLDERAGYGFVSICAVEILGMGLLHTPRLLRWDNRELLYRLAVRAGSESTFLTLRSDVSSRALTLLGRYFSHYRPEHARVNLRRVGSYLGFDVESRDGRGDASLEVDASESSVTEGSIFATERDASDFLLGMSFSADVVSGRIRAQPIEHSPWSPRFVSVTHARFSYLRELERSLDTLLVLDSALATGSIHQTWQAARWL